VLFASVGATRYICSILALVYVALSYRSCVYADEIELALETARTPPFAARSERTRILPNTCRWIALMAAMLEISGLAATRIHMLMGSLLVARFLHPLGIYAKPGTLQFSIGRVGGMVITMVSCALLILRQVLFVIALSTVFAHACQLGAEGIVSKRVDGTYRSGPCRAWIKILNPASPCSGIGARF
jgi:uncharacterized membrane protein YecN with MAPEG domain